MSAPLYVLSVVVEELSLAVVVEDGSLAAVTVAGCLVETANDDDVVCRKLIVV
jgi:hypothetical protein